MRTTRNIMFIVTTLTGLGLLMVYSSSGVLSSERLGDEFFFFRRQVAWLGLGLIMFSLGRWVKYESLPKFSSWFLVLSLILLALVFVPHLGRAVGGQYRWLKIWRFSFQPAEIAKLSLIFYAADFVSRRKQFGLKEFWPLMLVMAIVIGLILLQPDFGTAVIITILAGLILYVSGLKLRYLFLPLLIFIFLLVGFILKEPYRLNRLRVFFHPEHDTAGSGYQISQSFIALGSGGFFGQGLGNGRQKLLYLPASHTDFIFAIIGEELGLLGTITVVVLFICFLWQGIKVARFAPDIFGYYLALGITFSIAFQALINMSVVSGLLPNKGTPLPFISFGGTSLVVNFLSTGLLLNIGEHSRRFF